MTRLVARLHETNDLKLLPAAPTAEQSQAPSVYPPYIGGVGAMTLVPSN